MRDPISTRLIEAFYRSAAKPLLFRADPERVHDRFTAVGRVLASTGLTRRLTRALFRYDDPILATDVAGVHFENPVGLAAGFDKNAQLWNILPDVGFGFAELGSITGKPCEGNPKPRLWRMPEREALQVYYGLKNDGAEAIAARLRGVRSRMPLGISAAKTNSAETSDPDAAISDYCAVIDACRDIAGYYTINISCPNAFGGQPFTDPALLDRLLAAVDARAVRQPVFVKLSPDLDDTQQDAVLEVLGGHRVQGIVCTNLTKDYRRVGIEDAQVPGRGGISGRVVQQVAERQLARMWQRTQGKYALIGVGGIFTAEDAYRKIRLGASLVQLITGMVYRGPQVIGQINRGLAALLRRDGFKSVAEAVGVGT
ncbi:MAG: quinone-dependent dihydroorotate dehydrogenase [Candidatus Yanofskybacteria bacterium]|nr:quinone-dependent dihydroorotate dehydrogenase [Candidatus Yanofskybacteria bacterium]